VGEFDGALDRTSDTKASESWMDFGERINSIKILYRIIYCIDSTFRSRNLTYAIFDRSNRRTKTSNETSVAGIGVGRRSGIST